MLEKGKISPRQMAFMMYPTIMATAALGVPGITAKYAKQDLWLSPMFASLLGFLTLYIVSHLHKRYPHETVIQFSERIISRLAGKMLGALYLFFYTLGTGIITRIYGEFIVDSFLVNTPISFIMALMVFLCAFVVRGGIEVLGRIAELFIPAFILPLIIFILLLSADFEINNLFPMFEEGLLPALKGAIIPIGWFTEFFMMIFLLPFVTDAKKGIKYGFMTVATVMITLVVINLAVIFILGSTTSSKVYPLMQTARYISYADFFENLESFIMAIWILGMFVKISVFYYVVASGIAQWLKLSDHRPIVWPLGIVIIEFSFWSFPNTAAISHYNLTVFPFYGLLMEMIVPLFLLLIAVVRKRKRKEVEVS